ncbi:hypothetical protein C8R48DRAFT_678354 [Suillus tomentosus]|nr:hypothetical protein C8R48DRAFT_678354 [Suillus tomentosus]
MRRKETFESFHKRERTRAHSASPGVQISAHLPNHVSGRRFFMGIGESSMCTHVLRIRPGMVTYVTFSARVGRKLHPFREANGTGTREMSIYPVLSALLTNVNTDFELHALPKTWREFRVYHVWIKPIHRTGSNFTIVHKLYVPPPPVDIPPVAFEIRLGRFHSGLHKLSATPLVTPPSPSPAVPGFRPVSTFSAQQTPVGFVFAPKRKADSNNSTKSTTRTKPKAISKTSLPQAELKNFLASIFVWWKYDTPVSDIQHIRQMFSGVPS